VVRDDADSGSGDNNDHNVPDGASGGGPAQRVHLNPRHRAVAFEGRLPISPQNLIPKTKRVASPSRDPPQKSPSYNIPPGYEDVEDFGEPDEPPNNIPEMHPRDNSVSVCNICCM
jgi:hypothetical protein